MTVNNACYGKYGAALITPNVLMQNVILDDVYMLYYIIQSLVGVSPRDGQAQCIHILLPYALCSSSTRMSLGSENRTKRLRTEKETGKHSETNQ